MAWQREVPKPEKSVQELVGGLAGNVQEILRSEVRLAKAELTTEAIRAAKAGAILGAGIVLGIYAGWALLLTLIYALGIALPMWLSALIIFFLTGIVGGALIGAGTARMRRIRPTPEKTIQSMKENMRWARHPVK